MQKLLTLNKLIIVPDNSFACFPATKSSAMLRTLYTNADQFLNKRDLLSAQITSNHPPLTLLSLYSETSLIQPPSRPTVGGLINEVALLLKTLLMQLFKKLALLSRVSNS